MFRIWLVDQVRQFIWAINHICLAFEPLMTKRIGFGVSKWLIYG